jgi:hypothetical protein
MSDHEGPGGGDRGRGGLVLPGWAIGVIGVVVLALVAGLVLPLLSGGDDAEPAANPPPATSTNEGRGVSPAYASAVTGPVTRLTASANVTGRALTGASGADDVAKVGRTARQQLEVVQRARGIVVDIPTGPSDSPARGALLRATQAHRTYLVSLARLPAFETDAAIVRVRGMRTQARAMLRRYRTFFALIPSAPKGISTAGLADLTGLGDALAAKKGADAANEAAASRSEGDRGSSSGSDFSGSGSSSGPSISRVSAQDSGSTIDISADYCDRTPGTVNDFVYTFRIISGGSIVAEDSYGASQTRACNTISRSFSDSFGIGGYDVEVIVNNLTNNVGASGVGSLSVID